MGHMRMHCRSAQQPSNIYAPLPTQTDHVGAQTYQKTICTTKLRLHCRPWIPFQHDCEQNVDGKVTQQRAQAVTEPQGHRSRTDEGGFRAFEGGAGAGAYHANSHPASFAAAGLYAPGAIIFLRSHSFTVWSLQLLIR